VATSTFSFSEILVPPSLRFSSTLKRLLTAPFLLPVRELPPSVLLHRSVATP
jgi:hypothetical protein